MNSLPLNVLYYGKDEPLPEQVPLRAGPLTMIYEAGDLRYIKLGEREVVRRIYAAVRDRNWVTVPAKLSAVEMDVRADSFHIRYVATHQQGLRHADASPPLEPPPSAPDEGISHGLTDVATSRFEIDFVWSGEIVGEADGTIRFMFDGQAHSTFLKSRIGFCVLHPMRECAGAPCRVEYVDGRSALASFPRLVAADQPVKGIHDLRAIAHEVEPGVWAELRFDGDVFEMEDQRNWIDASFKTYCTPLRLPYPVEIRAGERVRQSVTLKLLPAHGSGREEISTLESEIRNPKSEGEPSLLTAGAMPVIEFRLRTDVPTVPLPALGLGGGSEDDLYSRPKRMHKRLKALRLAHVRVDLRLSACDWIATLFHTLEWAERLNMGLEIALYLTKSARKELDDFISYPPLRDARIARFMVFEKGMNSVSTALLQMVRQRLAAFRPGIPIGSGTTADFYELNLARPPVRWCDFICWSMNPQAHALDNTSLAEAPATIQVQLESAHQYFPGKPLVVSPLTLKPRFNPVATGKERSPAPGELPPPVDPRQMSLLGASWTLAALKYLAEAGAASVTLYETVGWRGVMEHEKGSLLPDKFRSLPATVFPLYHVLAEVGEFAGGEVILSKSSAALKVDGVVLQKEEKRRVLLANLTAQKQAVVVSGLANKVLIKHLDETNVLHAMTEPEKFRKERGQLAQTAAGRLELNLLPYAVARCDVSE